ncbi:MAG: N-methylhydantoinase, partial [Thermomicrobiales bacterium]|nr:N-methylhydantoinase [Thermomicrobiales bacterium]
KGVERVAAELKLNPLASAEGILTVARNNMANVTRQILVGQGYDPRDFALLSFGGGGGLFASEVARSLDIPTVVVPVHPAAFSAWGMLSADIVGSFARSYVRPIDKLDTAVVQRLFDEMESDATELMSDANIATDAVAVERSVDARYEGQGHEVEVSLDAVALENGLAVTLAERFDELHEIRYGHRMASARETVTFRLRAFGRMKKLRLDELPQSGSDPSAAVMGRRPVYLAGASRDCGVYDRSRLTVGNVIAGPAIVEEPAHVTVVLPGDELRVDRFGNLVITVGA